MRLEPTNDTLGTGVGSFDESAPMNEHSVLCRRTKEGAAGGKPS
jgi:hypothetical protein